MLCMHPKTLQLQPSKETKLHTNSTHTDAGRKLVNILAHPQKCQNTSYATTAPCAQGLTQKNQPVCKDSAPILMDCKALLESVATLLCCFVAKRVHFIVLLHTEKWALLSTCQGRQRFAKANRKNRWRDQQAASPQGSYK